MSPVSRQHIDLQEDFDFWGASESVGQFKFVVSLESKAASGHFIGSRTAPHFLMLSIGRKTAAQLLLFAKGFAHVENYRQLIAKAGLCPREYSSGSSVRGKTRITRMGGGSIRSKLFMCSFAAQ